MNFSYSEDWGQFFIFGYTFHADGVVNGDRLMLSHWREYAALVSYIIILSHPFSTPGHFSSHVLQPSHRGLSITAPRLWNDLHVPPKLRTISLPLPPSLPITRHHLHPAPLSVTPWAFHSKLKSHLFKHSYSDPSDHSPSPSERHPP